MLKIKKIAFAGALLAFAASAGFAQEFSFENTLSTDVVNIEIDGGEFSGSFAGFENETVVDFSSDKLDFGLDILFAIGTDKTLDDKGYLYIGNENFAAGYSIEDYYIEFRPVDLLGIGFHQGYSIAGSYLPVEDDNLEAGNIGSDLGVFIRPIEGLTIGAGLDFTSLFGGDDDWDKPYLNFGAEYEIAGLLSFGAAFRDIINGSRSIGAYVSFFGVENLVINGGFTYNGEFADVAGNLITVGASYELDALSFAADFVFDVNGDEDDDFDLYLGASVGYQITDAFGASVAGTFKTDFHNDDAWEVGIFPAITFAINDNNEVGAGADIVIAKDATSLAFPVYWTYSF